MESKDVTFFSTLLNIKAEEVEGAITDGSLGEKVTALGMLSKEQVDTLKVNHAKEVKSNHITELVEEAKKGDLNPELYKVIKGASYEMLEKDLSKEYGVTEFEGIRDLVSKAIKNKTGKTNDTALQELTDKHESLKQVNIKLVEEKDEAVKLAKAEYEGKLLKREQQDVTNKVPFEFSNVKADELETVAASRKGILNDVFNARYELGFDETGPVVMKEGKIMTNPATLEPLPVLDVMVSLATELGMPLISPESGGQGGRSSGGKGGTVFTTQEEFDAYCENNKINPTSAEGIKLFAASSLNPNK